MTTWVTQPLSRVVGGQVPQVPFIAGVSASTSTQAGHFTDQHGNPRLLVWDQNYGLFTNAGRWHGNPGAGTWQQDFDSYCASRAAQGVTSLMIEPIGCIADGGVFDNGNTWDNIPPFVTGQDPASGLNNTYWTRLDYLLNTALASGITITPVLDIIINTSPNGSCFTGWTNAQYQAFGAALGARYKNQPNIMWLVGDDSFPVNLDAQFGAWLTGIASAGDTHPTGVWWQAEYTSRYASDTNTLSAFGAAHSAFNMCYTYIPGYWIIEYAYGEVINQGQAALLPPAWMDGYRLSGSATYDHTQDRAWRQELWWCLTAGARGITAYDTNNYEWASAGDPATVTTDWSFVNALPNIVAAYTSWAGWHLLLPDLSGSFVTAGRGTRTAGEVSGGSGIPYEPSFANDYVSASITPDGTLACCYLPHAVTVTVNTALLAAGWAAWWTDPVTGAATTAGTSGTYNSAAKGSNSQGDPDWVLVFHT